ncbi:hypothetical protein AD950_04030 [Gluconobacter oxydans]|nr:hypothetical protein AD950_04030 [Gluconobacter oxydans]
MRTIIGKIREFVGCLCKRGKNVGLDAGLCTLEEEACGTAAEAGSEHWIAAMAQRREEMKRFMALGAVAAADERTELLRALNHARRAIDACAPYAETVEAMDAPEFREQINRLMMSLYGIILRRPDAHKSSWELRGFCPSLRAAINNGSEDA